jgi:hypothetical protein
MEVELQWRFEYVSRIEHVLGETKFVHVGGEIELVHVGVRIWSH